jgi:hypothetical protein
MIVEVEPAREGDFWTGRQQRLGLSTALGGEEVAAVDHRGGEGAMADERAGAGTPGRAGVALEAVGGVIAEALHGVAAFDQGLALRQEAFEFDRADF